MHIVYFSGTGNSRFVAEKIATNIKEKEIIPLISILADMNFISSIKELILVFPLHALTMPIVVRQFLRNVSFNKLEFISVIVTRHGIITNLHNEISKIAKKNKGTLNSVYYINMVNNDPRELNYKVPDKESLLRLKEEVANDLILISSEIKNRQSNLLIDKDYKINLPYKKFGNYLLSGLIVKLHKISEYVGGVNYFFVDDKCNKCGICKRVCLSGKIQEQNNVPIWDRNKLCYMCFACINFCPQKAIQIMSIPGVKSYTKNNDRFGHPFASIKEIENEKTHPTTAST